MYLLPHLSAKIIFFQKLVNSFFSCTLFPAEIANGDKTEDNRVSSHHSQRYKARVSFVLAFIQSLPYTSDSVTSGHDEYPRFPLETLVDNGGDCEDTAILFATLTLIMGYGTVYINPPEHYAVGILGEEGLPGYYFTYKDKRYYYCETTGDGWAIGDIPSEYQDVKATIYEINEYQQYVPESWNTPTVTPTPTTLPTTAPTPKLTPTPDIPEFPSMLLLPIVMITVVVGTLLFKRRQLNNRDCKRLGAR